MPKKLNIEEVRNFVKNNSECELLSTEYINNSTKMKFKCICGDEFETSFAKFKDRNKRQCSKCGRLNQIKKRKHDYEYIKNYIKINAGCDLLSDEYINNKKPLILKCKCGNVFKTTFDVIKGNQSAQCKECRMKSIKNKQKLSYEEVYKTFEKEKYILVSKDYINARSKLSIQCQHQHIFEMTLNDFKSGNRCPECRKENMSNLFRKKQEEAILEIESKGFEFMSWVDGHYKNTNSKAILKCNKGHKFKAEYDNIVFGDTGCPYCTESKGEKRIKEYLSINKIKFNTQYRFKNCKNKRPLPFDFYIPKYNICIEYDGEFHYKKTTLGNDLKIQKSHDKIKNNYCKNNNIKLLRIPYWEFDNIETILESVLP
ncbi:hypothetical protein [Clostridium botulinum]